MNIQDSGHIRERLARAEDEIEAWTRGSLDKAKTHALIAIAHALVNISDDLFNIRERLNEGVKMEGP